MLAHPQVSVGVTAQLTLGEHALSSLLTAMAAGAFTTGSVLSVTVTLKLLLALLPWMSVTVDWTGVVQGARVCGEVMPVSPSLKTMVSTPPMSAGVAAKLTRAEQAL